MRRQAGTQADARLISSGENRDLPNRDAQGTIISAGRAGAFGHPGQSPRVAPQVGGRSRIGSDAVTIKRRPHFC